MKRILLGLIAIICLSAMPAWAQHAPPKRPHRALRGAALADSIITDTTNKNFKIELGVDVLTHNDSVTNGKTVRLGVLAGQHFTIEVNASAARAPEGYFEATATLGLTASLLPGDNNLSGKYVQPLIAYHYEGGPAQLGVGLEVGARVLTSKFMAARASAFTIDYLSTSRLPTVTSIGAKIGISFWR